LIVKAIDFAFTSKAMMTALLFGMTGSVHLPKAVEDSAGIGGRR
jgi:hypothetical protein